jgi:hypothetical protein
MFAFIKTKAGRTVIFAVLAALGVVASVYCQPCVSVIALMQNALQNAVPAAEAPIVPVTE